MPLFIGIHDFSKLSHVTPFIHPTKMDESNNCFDNEILSEF